MPNSNYISDHADQLHHRLASLSTAEFQKLGVDGIAYIRADREGDTVLSYHLYAADGRLLTEGDSPDTLKVIARQNHLMPVRVH